MATQRMHRGLVALSASAIAAVYLAGYVRTQSADASIGAAALPTLAPSPSAAIAVAAVPSATATPVPRVVPTVPVPRSVPTATAAPAAAPSAALAGALKDGTYTGAGSSRRGDVWVSVEIQSGRIATVTITRSTLQYPLRDIAGLPAQVVQRQSAQVDIVSRATYSSQAFRTAVSQALSQAG
jgi:uncharacterized protein with FMN-binding domain